MMERIREFLRRRGGRGNPPQLRPNELRRDVVQAERRRREAGRARAAAPGAIYDEATAPRQRPPVVPARPVAPAHLLLATLKTRDGLRQAWLMSEILGAPVSMRDRGPGEPMP
jgi:hypothetical protein